MPADCVQKGMRKKAELGDTNYISGALASALRVERNGREQQPALLDTGGSMRADSDHQPSREHTHSPRHGVIHRRSPNPENTGGNNRGHVLDGERG
jgi:hypothetical protein